MNDTDDIQALVSAACADLKTAKERAEARELELAFKMEYLLSNDECQPDWE